MIVPHNRRVFFLAVFCGVMISISFYLFPLDGGAFHASRGVSPLLWPIYFLLASFQLFPRLFVARIIWEAMGAPKLLGHTFLILYWPIIGAAVGSAKHYLFLGIGVVFIHIALTALILYLLSRASIIFL